jgi:hypothetical protein
MFDASEEETRLLPDGVLSLHSIFIIEKTVGRSSISLAAKSRRSSDATKAELVLDFTNCPGLKIPPEGAVTELDRCGFVRSHCNRVHVSRTPCSDFSPEKQ